MTLIASPSMVRTTDSMPPGCTRNRYKTAAEPGIDSNTLYRKIKSLGLPTPAGTGQYPDVEFPGVEPGVPAFS